MSTGLGALGYQWPPNEANKLIGWGPAGSYLKNFAADDIRGVVDTIADLQSLSTVSLTGLTVFVRSYYAASAYADGIAKGGGFYQYDADDATADNGITIIRDLSDRCWKLMHGGVVTTGQAGCYVDNSTDDRAKWDALITLLNTGSSGINQVLWDAGALMLSDNPAALTANNITFTGLNMEASQMRFLSTATDKGCFFTLGTTGNPADSILIEKIGFINDDNELTLTGADAAINVVRANDLTIQNCYFSDCARWLILGADSENEHARKTNILFNTYAPSPKPDCDIISFVHATGTRFVGNRASQETKRYALHFDAQTANFIVGETVTGGTSGATGLIVKSIDNGTTGTLWISTLTGVFQNNETITTATGSATANIPSGLKTLAYDNRLLLIKPGTSSTGVDSVHFTANEFNWNAFDVEYLIEIDVTLKGVSNVYFASANVIDGGSIATFYIHVDATSDANNDRLHNLIINGNRITANGSGIGPVGVMMKIVQAKDNLLSGITVTGNNILGNGVLNATRVSGAADGYVSAVFSGNNIIKAADPTVAAHTNGGTVFYTEMSGVTIIGNTLSYQDEDNTYRFATFLETTTAVPVGIVCTGNLIDQISGDTAFNLTSLTNSADTIKTIVRNNAGKPDPAIRTKQTTDATVTTIATETLADGYTYRLTGRVVGVQSDDSNRASYNFIGIYSATGGAATLGANSVVSEYESDTAWNVTLDASGATARVRVTGKAATTINWGLYDIKLEILN
jgi:hypothetical protein